MSDILDQDALYYPYIHIRDVDWLRKTLVLFPHVVRIAPESVRPHDSDAIRPFIEAVGRRGPLVRRARLRGPTVRQAEKNLVRMFREEIGRSADSLRDRFGRDATYRQSGINPIDARTPLSVISPSSLHWAKASEVFELLAGNGLAWREGDFNKRDFLLDYVSVHPRLGAAIMMTVAIACARAEGLQIVTDNGQMHRYLADANLEAAFRYWLEDDQDVAPTRGEVANRLAFAVVERVPIETLTAENLAALNREWEPRGRFLKAIRDLSDSIPLMADEARLQEYIEQRADAAIRNWEKDKANLSSFVRKLFPAVGKATIADAAKKVVEKICGPVVAGSLAGSLTHGSLVAIGAGIGISVIAEAVSVQGQQRKQEADSPYRYLSLVQDVGLGYTISH